MPFFDGDFSSFFSLMHEYVDDKAFNNSFCDLVPKIMSNALNEVIVIINESDTNVVVTVIPPQICHSLRGWDPTMAIHLLKKSDHYDAFVPIPSFASRAPGMHTIVGRRRYGTDPMQVASGRCRPDSGPVIMNQSKHAPGPEANGFNDIDTTCITGANSLVKTFEIPRSELNMSSVVTDCPYDNSAFVARIAADGIYCTEKEPGGTLLIPSCKKPDAGFKEPNLCNDIALDTISYLDNLRTKFSRNLFIAHLNVNSLRYKFYEIYDILNGNRIDIFGISETKIDASFTNAQFSIDGFKLYRQDRDCKGGGILVYIKDSLPHRLLNAHTGLTNGVEYMSFEICFKRRKWFLVYMYRPPKVSNKCAWDVLSKLADHFVGNSNLTVFFGDINYDMYKDNILHDLCDIYDLKKFRKWSYMF